MGKKTKGHVFIKNTRLRKSTLQEKLVTNKGKGVQKKKKRGGGEEI